MPHRPPRLLLGPVRGSLRVVPIVVAVLVAVLGAVLAGCSGVGSSAVGAGDLATDSAVATERSPGSSAAPSSAASSTGASSSAASSSAAPTAAPTDGGSAAGSASLAVLATIPVKGRAPATGYARTDDFGSAWIDVDHNGCDTRDDILARDLTAIVRSGPCTVLSGTLVSPYTGGSIAFRRGVTTSTVVQIDHVVALEDAWQTGAQQLPEDRRIALANDPDNLFAVDSFSNEQKRAGDAATWLPSNTAFRCRYVEHVVTVKARYGLWVTPAEHDAIVRNLGTCGSGGGVSLPAPAVTPPVAQQPTSVTYPNCDAVRAAGAAPLHTGDPGYSRSLDRDGDGTACE